MRGVATFNPQDSERDNGGLPDRQVGFGGGRGDISCGGRQSGDNGLASSAEQEQQRRSKAVKGGQGCRLHQGGADRQRPWV